MNIKSIPVTQPFLPELSEFTPYLEKIWQNRWLTNNGPFHVELESELCRYLGVEHISLFNNATIALITALQAMRINGEVITTPYSFVATSHSIMWNGLEPVFVDIDPSTFNIDPEKIESAITSRTTAIMPVHCYSNPCDVEKIQKIADNYGLKIIYDAAHAFAIDYKGESILKWGDLSILSFHATKVFNTFEGGAIVCPDIKTKQRIDRLKNFGIADELTVTAPGINGKMSEINAAFGLVQLKHINEAIEQREKIDIRYRKMLKDVDGITLYNHNVMANSNYSYFPILVEDSYPISRDALYEKLKANNILSRRYFYPLISNMPMYRALPSAAANNLPEANKLSEKVLCLPIFNELTEFEQDRVINIIKGN
ncbi:dTDP-4-amino-4,6-dideoxy-D-glucose aminotransferase VioA [Citrobacter sp. Cf039]|uniref:dTDP-4-amino-4,6-dideoxy-D-glucose aminotransferase VioA n=1 Tax=Citrobacter TaxID=544 RepID=UPI001C709A15|nr:MULTISPECIES: dTDP-4-amino-4,6-dideoxy-D-glucose aminotransferase VioA [Citrobacter]EJB5573597.1 dTDP-4-amino-4,6-dideoxy-D-glucose aminotransferase VioA [Citrobacter freundii]MBW9589678.1 dTDP-4-amino-4,6-dideoxy-D-glucose aminotransferase VioA [Citrobacter freundii]MDM3266907.1 dTDP-4-amino-4,6-dideoxy-D-glucose aminotransferase VioA [Citrobacter sp. Cf039]MDM3344540.1 dTDP-4-amino-4,6-dideoxy-D-glucose aminotransferase VioA [Citrobacter sp. Cf115]MDS0959119.1 dTDP-4-amino-4,6-dideoxy-D-g